eukprot:gene25117-biopygen22470
MGLEVGPAFQRRSRDTCFFLLGVDDIGTPLVQIPASGWRKRWSPRQVVWGTMESRRLQRHLCTPCPE